jgi:hypothetical protein
VQASVIAARIEATVSVGCRDGGSEKSREEYPLAAKSGAGDIYLMHAGWAGKYAGQAKMLYGAGGVLAGGNGIMVPMGQFFQADGTAQMSASPSASPLPPRCLVLHIVCPLGDVISLVALARAVTR